MSSNRKKALIISYSDLNRDPRILRQIDFLSEDFDIYTAGLSSSDLPMELGYTKISQKFWATFHLKYPPLLRKAVTLFFILPYYLFRRFRDYLALVLTKNYNWMYWNSWQRKTLKTLMGVKFDIIVANDIDTLPLAIRLKERKGGKVYFDAHEYAPLEYENDPNWLKHRSPYYAFLCKKYVPFADYCSTVGHKIAKEYEELTGKHFDVVYNSPEYQVLSNTEIDEKVIKCVHHGILSPIRKIESMIEAFIGLGMGYELHLLLVVSNSNYFEDVKNLAREHANIIFHEPVPTRDIPRFINQFDISLMFIPPVNFNYKYCLPNKFFESIQARLMLLSGPAPEMVYLIDKYQLGIISSGFEAEDIISSLRNISIDQINTYKVNSGKVAEVLAAETIMKNLNKKLKQICAE